MHPKSPFHHESKELMCRPVVDDMILHKNVREIKDKKDRFDFVKLKNTLKRLNEQFYHLELAQKMEERAKENKKIIELKRRINRLREKVREYAKIILEE